LQCPELKLGSLLKSLVSTFILKTRQQGDRIVIEKYFFTWNISCCVVQCNATAVVRLQRYKAPNAMTSSKRGAGTD